MKELIDFFWNMPGWVFLLFAAVFATPFVLWFAFIFKTANKALTERKQRFNEMDKDFDRMRRRVRKNLE